MCGWKKERKRESVALSPADPYSSPLFFFTDYILWFYSWCRSESELFILRFSLLRPTSPHTPTAASLLLHESNITVNYFFLVFALFVFVRLLSNLQTTKFPLYIGRRAQLHSESLTRLTLRHIYPVHPSPIRLLIFTSFH